MGTNPLSNLKIDYWYKAFIVIGSAFFITSLTIELKGTITNDIGQLLSSGLVFWGTGEWINHPRQCRLIPPGNPYLLPSGSKIIGHNRQSSISGTLFDILSFILIGTGLYKLIF